MAKSVVGSEATYGKTIGPKDSNSKLSTATDIGSVLGGDKMVSIKNIGEVAATVAGGTLPAGETVTWQSATGVDVINYDATGTTLLIARGA